MFQKSKSQADAISIVEDFLTFEPSDLSGKTHVVLEPLKIKIESTPISNLRRSYSIFQPPPLNQLTVLLKMKLRIIVILVMAALNSLAFAEDRVDPKPPQMNIAEVYDLVVSLMELRENTQHKHFDERELKVISDALSTARFLKKMEHEDIARTPNISRYQFTHGFLGGTPRTGETESGMLTINCRTLYWKDWIFTLDEANAEKLKKLFPNPKNPLTKSELPAVRTEAKQAEQSGAGQPATRSESGSQGGDKSQLEAEGRSR